MKLNKHYQRGVDLGRITREEAERFQAKDEGRLPTDMPESMSAKPTRRRALDVKSMSASRKREE